MKFLIIVLIIFLLNCGSGMIGLLTEKETIIEQNEINHKIELLEFIDLSLIAEIETYKDNIDPYDFYDTLLPYSTENKKSQIIIYEKDNLYYLIITLESNGTPNFLNFSVTIITDNMTSDVLYEHSNTPAIRTTNPNSITFNLDYICSVDTFFNIIGPFEKDNYIYYLFSNVSDFNQVYFYSSDGYNHNIKDINVIIQF